MPRKATGKPPTWFEVAVRNAGFRKALKGLTWAYSWGIAREDIGHDPSVDEVADWWREPRRSAFREQAAFRECFPTLETPAAMFESPEMRRRLRELAKASNDLDQARRARKRPSETLILQLGMGAATL